MTNDLISREALLLALCESCGKAGMCRNPCVDYDLIVQAPAVDAAPVVHGRWIDGMKCSACGQIDLAKPNYCPNCGAMMRGKSDEAE